MGILDNVLEAEGVKVLIQIHAKLVVSIKLSIMLKGDVIMNEIKKVFY